MTTSASTSTVDAGRAPPRNKGEISGRAVLEMAEHLLERDGWGRGSALPGGQRCILMAIGDGARVLCADVPHVADWAATRATSRLVEVLPPVPDGTAGYDYSGVGPHYGAVVYFNDNVAEDVDAVLAVFRAARREDAS